MFHVEHFKNMNGNPNTIAIRDPAFIGKIAPENARRQHETFSKTVMELAAERLIEIEIGRFLPVTGKAATRERRRAS